MMTPTAAAPMSTSPANSTYQRRVKTLTKSMKYTVTLPGSSPCSSVTRHLGAAAAFDGIVLAPATARLRQRAHRGVGVDLPWSHESSGTGGDRVRVQRSSGTGGLPGPFGGGAAAHGSAHRADHGGQHHRRARQRG